MVKQKVAIIGGGIIGTSLAYYLSTLPGYDRLDVTLYDEGVGQATRNAAGIIAPWLSKRRNQRWYRLAKDGASLLKQLAEQAKLGPAIYQQVGAIVTRTNEGDLPALLDLARNRATTALQMGEVRQLSRLEVQAKIPLLTSPQPGVLIPGGARLSGAGFVSELVKQAETRNLTFLSNRVQLDSAANVIIGNETQSFDKVIVAAGARTADVLKPLGVSAHLRPQKGQLIELDVNDGFDQSMPVLMPEGEYDFIALGQGKLVVGATHNDDGGFDLSPSSEATADLLTSAHQLDAELTIHNVSGVRVGTRAYTPDFAPFFGHVPQSDNVYVASGLGSSGLTTGPIIGWLLANQILYNRHENWAAYTKPAADFFN